MVTREATCTVPVGHLSKATSVAAKFHCQLNVRSEVPLKKLRLTETPPLPEAEDMAVDDAERNSGPSGSPTAMTDSEDAHGSSNPFAKQGSQTETLQERRAKIQQRAWEEMRKYRQALRNCEGGIVIRDCA